MTRFRIDLRGGAFRSVLGFTWTHWRRQPVRFVAHHGGLPGRDAGRRADAALCRPAGRCRGERRASDTAAWNAAVAAFATLIGLAIGATAAPASRLHGHHRADAEDDGRHRPDAFHRVQRFSTDWHANSFAGSTVRKVTRGMWALDLLNDTILMALLPSLVMLVGSTVLLGCLLADDGPDRCGRLARLYRADGRLSLGYVAPAARLANAWDTKLGGSLADAVSCNAVVKAFGAEAREDARFARSSPNGAAARGAPGCAARSTARRRARRCSSCARRSSALRCSCGRAGRRVPATSPSC